MTTLTLTQTIETQTAGSLTIVKSTNPTDSGYKVRVWTINHALGHRWQVVQRGRRIELHRVLFGAWHCEYRWDAVDSHDAQRIALIEVWRIKRRWGA